MKSNASTRLFLMLLGALAVAVLGNGCSAGNAGPPVVVDRDATVISDAATDRNENIDAHDASFVDAAPSDTGPSADAQRDESDMMVELDADVDAGTELDAGTDSATVFDGGDDAFISDSDAGSESSMDAAVDLGVDLGYDASVSFDSGGAVSWHTETHPEGTASWVGPTSSIAVDATGNPSIAYYAQYEMELRYTHWNGSAWATQVVDTTHDVGSSCSLKLDSLGNPRIAYRDSTSGDLKFAQWTGSAWAREVVDAVGDVGYSPSLALDASDNAHISYYDNTNRDLKYARWTGASWAIETVDAEDDVGGYSSIAIDTASHPHIAYLYDEDPVGDLRYASWNGSA